MNSLPRPDRRETLHWMSLVHEGINQPVVYWGLKTGRKRTQPMRGPQPEPLLLSEPEKNELERLVRRHRTPQRLAARGRIILAAASGQNNCQIARQLQVSVDMVRHWRTRWLSLQAVSWDDLSTSERLRD